MFCYGIIQRDQDRLLLQNKQLQIYRLAMKNTQLFSLSLKTADTIEQLQTYLAPQPSVDHEAVPVGRRQFQNTGPFFSCYGQMITNFITFPF